MQKITIEISDETLNDLVSGKLYQAGYARIVEHGEPGDVQYLNFSAELRLFTKEEIPEYFTEGCFVNGKEVADISKLRSQR